MAFLIKWLAVLTLVLISNEVDSLQFFEQTEDDCLVDQYYDCKRKVCLDLCGAHNEIECTVEFFCSTHSMKNQGFVFDGDPSICLNHCVQECSSDNYCNHNTGFCEPCTGLCASEDPTACRIFCYDEFRKNPWSRQATPTTQTTIRKTTSPPPYEMHTLLESQKQQLNKTRQWKKKFEEHLQGTLQENTFYFRVLLGVVILLLAVILTAVALVLVKLWGRHTGATLFISKQNGNSVGDEALMTPLKAQEQEV